MHLLWRGTLALTTECVAMAPVAMVTWVWLALYRDNMTSLGAKVGVCLRHVFPWQRPVIVARQQ